MTSHIKPRIELDHRTPEHAANARSVERGLREQCPVVWTEAYDGLWVVSRFADVATVLQDHATFTSARFSDEDGRERGGIRVPLVAGMTPLLPEEMDPPEWNGYRKLLSSWFTPPAIDRRKDRILEFTTRMIDRVIESGEVDLVLDIANPVPALTTLDILGLPLADWPVYAEPFHAIVYASSGSPEFASAVAGLEEVTRRVYLAITEHRDRPMADLISYLIDGRVDGQPLTDDVIAALCFQLIGGGVDTTTALTSNTFMYLHTNPAARRRLIAEPQIYESATDEFLREFSPVHSVCRTATCDTELNGQKIRRNERVLVLFESANHDSAMFADPEQVDLERSPNRHAAFGLGIHRCIGVQMARVMFRTMISEVLRRLPDYAVDVRAARRYASRGEVNGWVTMPAAFTPGPRLAREESALA